MKLQELKVSLFVSSHWDKSFIPVTGYRVGRVRVVFSIPEKARNITFSRGVVVPQHLAYIEWYTHISNPPDRFLLLYKFHPFETKMVDTSVALSPLQTYGVAYIFFRNLARLHLRNGLVAMFLICVVHFM